MLLLNASWEPLAVVTQRRAFTLVWRDKAELVEINDVPMRSADSAWPAPSVVRLIRYVTVPRRSPAVTRRAVIERDGGRCSYCGCSGGLLTLDHVVPRSRGGRHAFENLVAACALCNNRKADRTPEEAGMPLRVKPYIPTTRDVFAQDPAWAPYMRAG